MFAVGSAGTFAEKGAMRITTIKLVAVGTSMALNRFFSRCKASRRVLWEAVQIRKIFS